MPPKRAASGLTHGQIADHNTRTVLELLRRGGPRSRPRIAEHVGLTVPGITNAINRLLAEGLIVEQDARVERSRVYALNPGAAFSIGARFRPDRIDGLVLDLAGSPRLRRSQTRSGSAAGDLKALLRELTVSGTGACAGIGIAAGDLDETAADTLHEAGAGLPVSVEGDAVAAIRAERIAGGATPDEGLVLILIEERVRAGLFLHGIPFAGRRGLAGRLGDLRIGDGRPLDAVAAAPAFRAAVAAGMEAGDWVTAAAAPLLEAALALSSLVAPRRVLLGGDLPGPIASALVQTMRERTGHPVFDRLVRQTVFPAIERAAVPHDGALLGAALRPLFDRYLPAPFAAG
jgi:predicted NBD/HSP70 family sugar kinase